MSPSPPFASLRETPFLLDSSERAKDASVRGE